MKFKKANDFIEWGMIHWRIVITLCAIMVGFGVYSFLTMQRQEFPDFTVRQGIVVGVMPGATSKEVEERMTRPVEDYLFSFNEVNKKKTYSVSKEGQVFIMVELNGQISGQAAPAFWAKLRLGLNELKAQKLPGQVLALIGNNDFGDTSAVLFTLVAEGRSPRELSKYVEVLQSHLRRIDATAKLRTYGAQEEVIRITISRERLSRYGIRPASVWASLSGLGGIPAPARLDTEELEIPIHVSKVLKSEAELGDTILLSIPTGQQVRLKDIADIKREYGHDDSYVRYNGKTAMVLSIEMQSGNDITHFGDQVTEALEQTKRELPPGVTIARVADQPEVVRTSINNFLRDFGLAIISVIFVTMLLLPMRVASVAAISIPVTIAITLAVLNAMGIQLQTVSLAGLVVVLGMVVDNAIVVVDGHLDKLDRGMDAWTAAWKSARELAIPVLTATIAIILSYVPMPMFLDGMAADFIGTLPQTVAIALTVSMIVALMLVPVLSWRFIPTGLKHDSKRPSMLDRLQRLFDRAIESAFRHHVMTLSIGALSVVVAILIARGLPQQMFPKVERNQFAVEVYLPNGRSLEATDKVIQRLEKALLADKRVNNVTAFVGTSSPRFHTVYAPHMPSRNYGQLLVNTVSDEATVEVLTEFRDRMGGEFPEGWIRWKQLEMSSGTPVEVRLSGTDIAVLKETAAKIEAFGKTIPGTTWVRNDYEEARQSIEVIPDVDSCARLGIPPAMLQMSLAIGSQGFPVSTLWENEDPIRVILQDNSDASSSLDGLRQQYVSSTFGGASVPLDQIATMHPEWSEGSIVRRNGVRTLTIGMDVGMNTLGSEVQKQVEKYVDTLNVDGVHITYGGEKELTIETFVPMSISMVVSIALIFLVLLFQFKRFRKVVVVMLTMPLSLLGAFLGLTMMGYPFGMTAFMGIIGLLGIVVRNGIILVSYAEELRLDQGIGAKEAAIAAGKRRMRPIYLTSMAAAIGVVPMILSRSTLWGPLGSVTCFGLLAAMVLTLFILPVVYWLVVKEEKAGPHSVAKSTGVVGVLLALLVMAHGMPAQAEEGPYTLARCQEMALENNAGVESSNLELEAAKETSAAVFTKYFPQVSISALGLVALDPLVKISTQGGNLPVYDGNPANLATATQFAYMPAGSMSMAKYATVVAASAVQPLFAGGRIWYGNKLAKIGVDAARDQIVLSRQEAVAQTEDKYWQLIGLGEKVRTLDAYEALLKELDKQVSDAVKGGLITSNDQMKVRLKRSEAGLNRQRLESGIRLASRDFRRHLGLSEGDEIALADRLNVPEDPSSLADGRQGAIGRRPEIRLLESAVRAENLQVKMKRGEMLPSLSVAATAMRADVEGMPGQTNVMVLGVLNIPISGIWEGVHTLKAQRQRALIAEKRLEDVSGLIALGVEKDWSDLMNAWNAVRVADESVAQAEVNLNEVTSRHASGLVTFSDVLEAQVLRQKTVDERIDIYRDFWLKRAAYLRSTASN